MSKTKASPAFVAAIAKPECKAKNTVCIFVDLNTRCYRIEIRMGAKRFTSDASYSHKKRAEAAAVKLDGSLGIEVKL